MVGALHAEIYASELFDTRLDGFLQAGWASHVDRSDAKDLWAGTGGHERLGHGFGFLDVSADNAGIGAEMDHCSHLGAADAAVATCAEDNFIFCDGQYEDGIWQEWGALLKMPSFQTSLR
jgi:hypothetical protein